MLIAPVIAVPILLILLIILLFKTRRKPEKKVKDPRTDHEKLREFIDARLTEDETAPQTSQENSAPPVSEDDAASPAPQKIEPQENAPENKTE